MNVASFVQGLAALSWVLVVGAIGFAGFMVSRRRGAGGAAGLVIGMVVLALVLTVAGAGLVFIEPTEAGVVVSALEDTGVRPEPLTSGLHWITPVFERVERYPTTRQTYTMSGTESEGAVTGDDSIQARTADGQVVFIDASVIFRINAGDSVNVHTTWRSNYVADLVRPQVRGIIRDIASQYGVEEIVTTRRAEMSAQITEELSMALGEGSITLVDFVLRNITFTPEYAASIEQKQIAEQEAQRAQFIVEQRKQEAEQARAQAQGEADAAAIRAEGNARALVQQATGEAEAIRLRAEANANALELLGEALETNPDLLEYTYVTNLSDNIELMLVPSESPYLFSLPDTANPGSFNQPNTSTPPVTTPPADDGGG